MENTHRHVEFFVFPYSDEVIRKALSFGGSCAIPPSTSDMEEAGFKRALESSLLPQSTSPTIQKQIMRGNFESRRPGPAYAIYPSDRFIRSEEME